MNNFIERFVIYMEFKGLNKNKVTVQAGLTNAQLGNAIKTGKGFNSDTIVKILQTYRDLNPSWWLLGEGEMILNSDYDTKDYSVLINELTSKNKEIKDKDLEIRELYKQIGKLEHQIELLKKDKPYTSYRNVAEP